MQWNSEAFLAFGLARKGVTYILKSHSKLQVVALVSLVKCHVHPLSPLGAIVVKT